MCNRFCDRSLKKGDLFLLAEKITLKNEVKSTEIGCQLTLDDYIQVMYPKANECGYVALAHKIPKSQPTKVVLKEKTAEEVYKLALAGQLKEKEVPYDFKQRCYTVNELLDHVELDKDCYTSMNTFFIARRRKSDVRHLNALFVDIDYYNVPGVTKETVLETLQFNIDKELIPKPTFIIDSGRGIYFIWKIEDVPGKYVRATNLYMVVQNYIGGLFKDVGADDNAKDVSRVLRLPASTNTKANNKVKVIEYNEEGLYALNFFQEYVNVFEEYSAVPKGEKKQLNKGKKKQRKNINIKHLYNTYTLHIARMRDLETLCSLRDYDVMGLRHQFIYIYYYYNFLVHKDKNIALFNTKKLNAKFNEPLEDSEVRSFITSAERSATEKLEGKEAKLGYKSAGYNFKNEKLIKIFKITEDEQKHLKTIISKEEKYDRNNTKRKASRRNEDGLTKRQQNKQYLVERVKQLKERGYKQREIAEMMEISKGRVSQILKELKKV